MYGEAEAYQPWADYEQGDPSLYGNQPVNMDPRMTRHCHSVDNELDDMEMEGFSVSPRLAASRNHYRGRRRKVSQGISMESMMGFDGYIDNPYQYGTLPQSAYYPAVVDPRYYHVHYGPPQGYIPPQPPYPWRQPPPEAYIPPDHGMLGIPIPLRRPPIRSQRRFNPQAPRVPTGPRRIDRPKSVPGLLNDEDEADEEVYQRRRSADGMVPTIPSGGLSPVHRYISSARLPASFQQRRSGAVQPPFPRDYEMGGGNGGFSDGDFGGYGCHPRDKSIASSMTSVFTEAFRDESSRSLSAGGTPDSTHSRSKYVAKETDVDIDESIMFDARNDRVEKGRRLASQSNSPTESEPNDPKLVTNELERNYYESAQINRFLLIDKTDFNNSSSDHFSDKGASDIEDNKLDKVNSNKPTVTQVQVHNETVPIPVSLKTRPIFNKENLSRKKSKSLDDIHEEIKFEQLIRRARSESCPPEENMSKTSIDIPVKAKTVNQDTLDDEDNDFIDRNTERIREWAEKVESTMLTEQLPSPVDPFEFTRHGSAFSTSSASTVQQTRYTVEQAPKTQARIDDQVDICRNIYSCSAKWLVSIILALLLLFCVTANKICLLIIGHEYSTLSKNLTLANSTMPGYSKEGHKKEAIFLILVLIMMIPQGYSLLYGIWDRRRSNPWPRPSAIRWILAGGLVETSCLCFLTICAPTVLEVPPDLLVLLLSTLFFAPTVWQVHKMRKRWGTKAGKIQTLIFGVSAALQLVGLIVLINTDRITRIEAKIAVPISLVLLSVAWSPKIRKLQTKPRLSAQQRQIIAAQSANSLSRAEGGSATLKIRKKSARAKAALIMSVVKVAITPLISILFCSVFKVADITQLGAGLTAISGTSSYMYFLVQIFSTFAGYHLAWLACAMCVQKIGFALPLTLATPFAFVIVQVQGICGTSVIPVPCGPTDNMKYVVAVGLFIWVGQFISTGYYVWKSNGYIMGKANHLFWLPSYNGPLLEPNLLLNRRNQVTDDDHVSQARLSRDTYVFICTTMYHEEDYEMEQLLNSLHDVDSASKQAGRHIESHVFFDGCIKAEKMNSYILQLVSLVETSLKVQMKACVKVKTPYGMQLRWKLPGGMPFTVHLKDNTKVKNKKRWSQVMYMSYVLDHKQKILGVRDDQTFILTTDADVNFKHDSMEALIDYMLQDETIGAVCGRTHPMGKGPLVWYQIFDYAIGHWFMKVANHMFGSVLCCPGCFSLYRCQAVRDILPTYSTTVNEAFEFLTKDMGEDRWMCTLMVQAGWRLMYCAAAEDVTYCPMNFDEFYKQRRRWMPSTLANLALLISEWRVTLGNNEHISVPFIIFQLFLLVSTIIGPSTVILVIVGGMVYGVGANENTSVILLSLITLTYGLICLFMSQDFQLKTAKFLTFVFAVIMILVTIGVAAQIANELEVRRIVKQTPTIPPNSTVATPTVSTSVELMLPAGISTLYLGGLAGIFMVAALMHPTEAYCLINGLWYLLCLPSGYLLLTIYSVVNMTDRSWGTREGKAAVASGQKPTAFHELWFILKERFSCCCEPLMKAIARRSTKSTTEAKTEEEKKEENIDEKEKKRKPRQRRRAQTPYEDEYSDDESSGIETSAMSDKEGPRYRPAGRWDSNLAYDDGFDMGSRTFSRMMDPRGVMAMRRQSYASIFSDQVPPYSTVHGNFLEPPQIRLSTSSSPVISRDRSTKGSRLNGDPTSEHDLADFESSRELLAPGERHSTVPSKAACEYPGPRAKRNSAPPDLQPTTSNGNSLSKQSASQESAYVSEDSRNTLPQMSSGSIAGNGGRRHTMQSSMTAPSVDELRTYDLDMIVEEWLKGNMKVYIPLFKEHGYDNLKFISTMTEKDLETIGITTRGHRQKLSRHLKKIPKLEIDEGVPDNVQQWLEDLSLGQYWPHFVDNSYTEPSDLEDVKSMGRDLVQETFRVHKMAHINILWQAIRKLQYPNTGQVKIRHARRQLDRCRTIDLEVDNSDDGAEYDFWDGLREACLKPELAGFDGNTELKDKLEDLRNTTLMVFLISNVLWMIVIMVLVKHSNLKLLGVDFVGLMFLSVYGTIILFQFIAMLAHRLTTLIHLLARAPYICGVQEETTVVQVDNLNEQHLTLSSPETVEDCETINEC
ncbi:uncharacterized protein LOC5517022 [Nematostella vectensis]|uniref:uncharacterized protein LOC5517022 n=1 Tax=Nematostella vectensis TaxID=45351 RepID=UPI00138FBF94|nr:uncharacterized protein LOC5517022 [Nematostella vectensis]